MKLRFYGAGMILISAVAGSVSAPASAEPTFVSGLELMQQCSTRRANAFDACNNYIRGVADSYSETSLDGSTFPCKLCFPVGVDDSVLVNTVLDYMKLKSTNLQTKASRVVGAALAARFSCK